MANMHNMGITVLRVWVNEADMGDVIDGSDNVTGVTPTWTANFANMVQLAANNNIQLYVTLNNGRYDWLTNSAQAASYLTNALIPLITTYKGNTNIFAIDLMNEIDGVVQGSLGNYSTTGGTWPQAQAYITTFAAAIHSADPTRKVSCSTGWHQWYNLSYFRGLGLDFYDYHNYQDTPSFPRPRVWAWTSRFILENADKVPNHGMMPFKARANWTPSTSPGAAVTRDWEFGIINLREAPKSGRWSTPMEP